MDAVATPVQYARASHRHLLPSLIYVVLDEGNGGIVRNLNQHGMAIQAVAALRPRQLVHVRFQLHRPRVKVEAQAEVIWANSSGQCGLRFLDLPPALIRQINEWIFGSLLDSIPHASQESGGIFGAQSAQSAHSEDGLVVSPTGRRTIQLATEDAAAERIPMRYWHPRAEKELDGESGNHAVVLGFDWLANPLSARSLALVIDILVMVAAFLIFSVVFLTIAHELPPWPLNLAAGFSAAVFVPGLYSALILFSGGRSLGHRLAELSEASEETAELEDAVRFR
jgi:PilZ domain